MNKILIISANRGIGLALAEKLSKDDIVYATCRSANPDLDQITEKVFIDVDVTNENSLQKVADHFAEGELDWVIHNPGIWSDQSINDFDTAQMLNDYNINALGAMRMAKCFHNKIKSGGKIGLITSRMGSIADNTSGGRYSYRMSKAALNSCGKSLSIDLKPQGIAVAIIHPGSVQTRMGGVNALITAEESAQGIIERLNELNLDNTGTFWHENGQVLPW